MRPSQRGRMLLVQRIFHHGGQLEDSSPESSRSLTKCRPTVHPLPVPARAGRRSALQLRQASPFLGCSAPVRSRRVRRPGIRQSTVRNEEPRPFVRKQARSPRGGQSAHLLGELLGGARQSMAASAGSGEELTELVPTIKGRGGGCHGWLRYRSFSLQGPDSPGKWWK